MRGNTKLVWRIGALCAVACCATAQATDGVVSGAQCNEAGFETVLAAVDGSGGGRITFQCGTATIAFTHYKTIAGAVVVDGGGAITFDGGDASPFFQVFFSANATLRGLTLQHGRKGDVHALENFGTLRLDHVRLRDNVSDGPAVANDGTLLVQASTFSGNRNTAASGGDGGAIANRSGTLVVRASTFDGNAAARNGGAIYSGSTTSVANATFTANSAVGGAAFYQDGSGASRIDQATIAANQASFGGGVYNEGSASATLTIAGTIFAGNSGGNCDGVLVSDGYNLWSGATQCPFSQPGDAAGDAQLGALANNGGATQTMLPGSGSAAIDRIPVAQCAPRVDQRGGVRPAGAGCDSGAVEAGAVFDVIFQDGFDF